MFDMLIQFLVKAVRIWSAVVDKSSIPLNWLCTGTLAGYPAAPVAVAVSLGVVTVLGSAFAYRQRGRMDFSEHLALVLAGITTGLVAPFVLTGILALACVFCGVVGIGVAIAPVAMLTWAAMWLWDVGTTPKSKSAASLAKSKRRNRYG